jgi:pyridoxine 4-dehydrogenase
VPREVNAARAGSVKIGDRAVHRLGLGTNRVTNTEAARAVIGKAIEWGVDFIDTADVYQATASEETLGGTLGQGRPDVMVATKGGMVRTPGGRDLDGRPEYLRKAVEASLTRLRVPSIELYQLHRVDPEVPIETSVGALKDLQEAGLIRRIGLSNVTVEELERARKVASIVSVQNRYNLLERDSDDMVDYCESHSIAFIPWTPVQRGKIGSSKILSEIAASVRATPHQLALRWLLMRSPVMLPIPGTLSLAHLEENLGAADVELTEEQFRRLSEPSVP